MRVAIGSDHAGFRIKELIKDYLHGIGVAHHDFGTYNEESVDYPDFAMLVAEAVARKEWERGILICGTGIGVAIAANKVLGIRAALCSDTFSARSSREHNDANVLTLGERVVGPGLILDIVKIWLETDFAGGRHSRRVEKITQIESKYNGS